MEPLPLHKPADLDSSRHLYRDGWYFIILGHVFLIVGFVIFWVVKHISTSGKTVDMAYAFFGMGLSGWIVMGSFGVWKIVQAYCHDDSSQAKFRALLALRRTGVKKALPLIEKALEDPDFIVRCAAVNALGRVGGEKARDILLKRLDEEQDQQVLIVLSNSLRKHYAGDPAVQKALKDSEPRLPKEQPQPPDPKALNPNDEFRGT